jgi:hypothetical protein
MATTMRPNAAAASSRCVGSAALPGRAAAAGTTLRCAARSGPARSSRRSAGPAVRRRRGVAAHQLYQLPHVRPAARAVQRDDTRFLLCPDEALTPREGAFTGQHAHPAAADGRVLVAGEVGVLGGIDAVARTEPPRKCVNWVRSNRPLRNERQPAQAAPGRQVGGPRRARWGGRPGHCAPGRLDRDRTSGQRRRCGQE